MHTIVWLGLVLGSLVAGGALVGVLVAPRHLELPTALVGLAGFAATMWAFLRFGEVYPTLQATLLAVVVGTASFIGGYALASALLDRLVDHPSPPSVPHDLPAAEGVGVIVCADAEPPRYSPRATATELARLVDEELMTASIALTPFLFAASKARYRGAGGTSPACSQLGRITERISDGLDDRLAAQVRWSTSEGTPRLAVVASELLSRGLKRIVVAPLAVSASPQMTQSLAELDEMHLSERGVRVVVTRPPVDSDDVLEMLASRILDVTDVTITGVALVARALSDRQAQHYPSFEEAETAVVGRVAARLTDAGIPEDRVRTAWAEWHMPDTATVVRHLAAVGCTRIVVAPVCDPLDSLATILDLEASVRRARLGDEVSVITLSAWGEDSAVVSAMVAAIESAVRGDADPQTGG